MKKRVSYVDATTALFPSFCRFVILIGKVSCNYQLMGDVIRIYDESIFQEEGTKVLIKALRTILLLRDKNTTQHIESVISIVVEHLQSSIDKLKAQKIDYIDYKAVQNESDGWRLIIETILDHGKFASLLIQALLQSMNTSKNDEMYDMYRLVMRDILLLSCKKCNGKAEREIRETLRQFMVQNRSTSCVRDDTFELMVEAVCETQKFDVVV